jgi:fatty acid desaturase
MATIARNIGPSGRRRRVIAGVALLVGGLVAAVLLVVGGVDRGARLALFAPFFGAAIGLLQARDHTCVMLAARNQCEIDRSVGAIADPWLAGQLRRQAREVLLESVVVAAFLTGLVLLLPG